MWSLSIFRVKSYVELTLKFNDPVSAYLDREMTTSTIVLATLPAIPLWSLVRELRKENLHSPQQVLI